MKMLAAIKRMTTCVQVVQCTWAASLFQQWTSNIAIKLRNRAQPPCSATMLSNHAQQHTGDPLALSVTACRCMHDDASLGSKGTAAWPQGTQQGQRAQQQGQRGKQHGQRAQQWG